MNLISAQHGYFPNKKRHFFVVKIRTATYSGLHQSHHGEILVKTNTEKSHHKRSKTNLCKALTIQNAEANTCIKSQTHDTTALQPQFIHSFIHSLVFSLEGRAWQEPEPSHVTGMALAHCILGKFLGGSLPLLSPRL